MLPMLSPALSSISLGGLDTSRTLSTSSLQSLSSASSSTSSLRLPEGDVEVVREEGLRHSKVQLEAR
jgi:choline kinase